MIGLGRNTADDGLSPRNREATRRATVVVIGGGQSGLSAAYHLKRRGFHSAVRRADSDPDGELVVDTSHGQWVTQAIINATGTWTNPVRPHYPGQENFLGRQLHTHDYVSADELAGLRVAVVGGGISAIQQLEEISRVATTFWYTRREPVFREGMFNPEAAGREIIAKVVADVEAGKPTGSVVSYTELAWTPYALAAKERGALERRPMFTAIEPRGVREAVNALLKHLHNALTRPADGTSASG